MPPYCTILKLTIKSMTNRGSRQGVVNGSILLSYVYGRTCQGLAFQDGGWDWSEGMRNMIIESGGVVNSISWFNNTPR